MREIKFRGKSVDTGEWIYGAYLQPTENIKKHFIISLNEQGSIYKEEVIPQTVGQYTTHNDTYHVEIYEGDILQGQYYPISEEDAYVLLVEYDEDTFLGVRMMKSTANVSGVSHGVGDTLSEFAGQSLRIIGNIHDDPDMILD